MADRESVSPSGFTRKYAMLPFVTGDTGDHRWQRNTSGWWFGTSFIFPYIENNHPNWLIFFRGVGIPPTRLGLQRPITGRGISCRIRVLPPDFCGLAIVLEASGTRIDSCLLLLSFLVGGFKLQTFYIFHNIWDNPSHWRTHIFQDD